MSTPFPASVYAARLDRARALTAEAGLDAIVVGPGPDLTYLAGVEGDTIERLTALVIPTAGEPTAPDQPTPPAGTYLDNVVLDVGF